MFNTGASGGDIFIEGHMAPSRFWPQFLVPHCGLPLTTFLFVWQYPDIPNSVLESESKEPLEEEKESHECSSHVEVPLLELEEPDTLVLGVVDLAGIEREDGA